MVTAVIFGVVVLGERLPSNTSALHMWLASWSCILLGVVAISGVTVDDLPVSAAVTAAGEVVSIHHPTHRAHVIAVRRRLRSCTFRLSFTMSLIQCLTLHIHHALYLK